MNNPPPFQDSRSFGNFGTKIAMGRRLAAVLVPFVNSNQPRFSSVVIAFDRIGEEFTLARGVYSAGGDDEMIPDIDMSGRRLIVSRYESPNLTDVFIGRVVILEFDASPVPATQADHEDADQGEADEPLELN